jgi:plastocyanin
MLGLLPVVAALVVLTAQAALAVTRDVAIQNSAFNPATTKLKIGSSARWTNMDSFNHTSTSDGDTTDGQNTQGVALWKSPNFGHNATFTFVFFGAGTFPYHCSIHSFMHGSVKVAPKVKPTSGPAGTQFKVTWSTQAPPANYSFTVQRNTGSGWGTILNKTTTTSLTVTAVTGTTYMFRIEMVHSDAQGNVLGTSGFSPAKSFTTT